MSTRHQRQAMTDASNRLRNWANKVPTVAFISPNSCLVFLATPAHIFRTRRQRCVPNLTTAYPPLHPRSAISCTVTPPLPLCRVCHCTLSEKHRIDGTVESGLWSSWRSHCCFELMLCFPTARNKQLEPQQERIPPMLGYC